ncbi:MAG: tRNA epoxyqueuosine(34) reductase QueG [Candidatus Eisenbacteria bacterium]
MKISDAKTKIKDIARDLGIDGIGFCDAGTLDGTEKAFRTAIERGFIPARSVPRDSTLARLTTPARHLKGARSVISAYQSYFTGEPPCSDPGCGTIAAYTRSNYYEDLKRRLKRLAGVMERDFGCRTKAFSCYVTLAEKPLARRAGLGFYGKNGVIVTPIHGSYVVLGEIITDLELEPDEMIETTCGSCRLCMDACPTGAIRTPYFIDRNICIQHLSSSMDPISPGIRERWANRLYGCSACQEACPYNSSIPPTGRDVAFGAVGSSARLDEIIAISEDGFSARFSDNQIGIRGRNAIRRNAIMIAGNSRLEALLPLLRTCATDDDPVIRLNSLWAIARIKDPSAKTHLEAAMRREQDGEVLMEIKSLLDGFGPVE